MTDVATDRVAGSDYAVGLANDSYEWYRTHAIRARRNFRVAEIILLVVAAAVPTSAVVVPHNATVPAILGAIVVVLSGLRSLFHWQDNYVRFSGAREAIEGERRGYKTGAKPYDDPHTRDQVLVAAVSRIEQDEMRGWTGLASERPKT
jgi:Protein of unknown function (DUF4231)